MAYIISKESHLHNSKPMENISNEEDYDEQDTLSLSHLPIEKNDESAADRDQTPSPQKIHDMFQFSSPNNQQRNVIKPTRFAVKSPEHSRYLVTQASPVHYPMLSKSSSKTSTPGRRGVKKSEDYVYQKSRSTSLYSRSKKSTKGGLEQEYEEKVSIFTSPTLKAKWLFVLLGLPPKIPTDAVELKTDIKNRQSRHAPSTFFPINVGGGGGCEVVVPEDSPRPKASDQKRKKSRLGSCFGSVGPVQI
ncbi:hypothetical protein POM88_020176 [Heracleum sosnowskyi]|uniref:Uncharacterized protein n=1 Tax=Heracleum sosnowskyi TaxID=360622 RepID=A0AAD8MR80_9APIA|nr:hypothetical protein POM88_020176 [Heracleum sosnowskyi]